MKNLRIVHAQGELNRLVVDEVRLFRGSSGNLRELSH